MTSANDRVVPAAARRRRRPTKTGVVLSEELIVQTALRLLRSTAPTRSPSAASGWPWAPTRAPCTATSVTPTTCSSPSPTS